MSVLEFVTLAVASSIVFAPNVCFDARHIECSIYAELYSNTKNHGCGNQGRVDCEPCSVVVAYSQIRPENWNGIKLDGGS